MTATLPSQTPVRPPAKRKSGAGFLAWLAFAGVVSLVVTLVTVSTYVSLDMSQSRPAMRGPVHYALLIGHIATGFVALLAGFAQFVPQLRNRHPVLHRWVGRGYMACVFSSSAFGVVVANLSLAGLSAAAPLTLLAVMWFSTALCGLNAARQRDFRAHRVWLIRNFALTTAAVTARLWAALFFSTVADGGEEIVAAANWLGFVVNAIVAEWWLQRRVLTVR
ncbi:hypothetical protein Lesp02_11000 [Lentzea sp. NBRC 105346]|uniref:DUF2306 domain-containing protein n=1 Tax=Lentzea sp. NBRC 105346 TaxID=3032205 RepID=UPI0024A42F5F|nr:DUF2306 domain-containing protein [Lentzea sp. NBRC 105346]GLZ28910.1 hypothetical protein Lesp02_11000 [Lentzea sp. NBRC 105346]